MYYDFQKLRNSHPQIMSEALRIGRLTTNKMFIELPYNFDFKGERPANVHVPASVAKLQIGSAVAKIAQPIAKAIDKVAGTNMQGCGGCKAREMKLNEIGQKIADKLTGQDSKN